MKTSLLSVIFVGILCGKLGAQTVVLPNRISQQTVVSKPFSVIGPRGALLGEQDGRFEAWVFPWKIFSHLRITAEMENYRVPIDVNEHAAWIDVEPDHTTITYSHANFTIRQTMLAPRNAPNGTGVLVMYQVEAVAPITLTFSFDPVVERMWPAPSGGPPDPEWVADASLYLLHQALPGHAAAIAMPGAQPGILAPYQERARTWPLQFVLHVDPAKDHGQPHPLLIAMGDTPQSSTRQALTATVASLGQAAAGLAAANADAFKAFQSGHTRILTPDADLNAAFSWAEVAIEQLRVETTPDHAEQAFTAGYVGSGDSERPGFGWFFGRDSLWTLYAVDSYGDFEASRKEFDFLLRRQRDDGAIMHEWSQTADLVDWRSLPYEYAAADATPLLLMAMNDYVKTSGDTAYAAAHWKQLALAWNYETTHDSPEGVYTNRSGTGWVESWIPSMPQQELYLAALDEQASQAYAHLAQMLGHPADANAATARATKLRGLIEQQYYQPSTGFYAFSHNADGSTDNTATVFPAVAWWDGTYALAQPQRVFPRLASSEFSTDWGPRLLSDRTSFYDPISYHQGTVWPLFTGWLSLAEYRSGHPLAGYLHMMQNANLTWAQDPGSVTELLSGEFYQVLGRSTAHQLWSSAMVISPILRGLFGLEWDAQQHTLTLSPQLPADWDDATIEQLPFGDGHLTLHFTRRGQELLVSTAGAPTGFVLCSATPGAKLASGSLHIPLPAVEAVVKQSLPPFGATTQLMKVLDQHVDEHSLTLTLEAQAGSQQQLQLRVNRSGLRLRSDAAQLHPHPGKLQSFTVSFPPGEGYVTKTVHFSW